MTVACRILAVFVVLVVGCANGNGGRNEGPSDISVVASGLDTIWAVDFAPDGRIFLTERPGRIRVVPDDRSGDAALWATLDVAETSESGLMGLALHPEFPGTPFVYVCYTYRDGGGLLVNRVSRLRETGGEGTDEQVLLDGMDGANIHDGCRLAFGPDGLLHVTMGDATDAANAQDPSSRNGKVLRIGADGSIPAGNPFGTAVFTLGHRNPQGIDFHPDSGVPYVTEHGPENHDEVNVLRSGRNYGWPNVRGSDDGGGELEPALWSSGPDGTVAPAGGAFVDAPGSSLDGAFVFATLKAEHLHVLRLDPDDPARVTGERTLLAGRFGRLRACRQGPDGALYLSTSNRDGRGSPAEEDDRLIRVPLSVLE